MLWMRPPIGREPFASSRTYDGAGSIVLAIRDYGMGVQDPTRLFETFFTTKEKGLGMGLAISRSIVRRMAVNCGSNPPMALDRRSVSDCP